MSCRVVACPIARVHHHHATGGTVLAMACFCTRPERVEQPTTPELLDFAAAHPGKLTGRVEEVIRTELRITPVRYLQLLGRAIQTVEALEHDPLTTHRLRREAERRARTRGTRVGH